jgi:hypothetical protein
VILRAFAIWVLLLILAILNGGARDILITPKIGDSAGHIISTIFLCVLILLVSYFSIHWINPTGSLDPLIIGSFWVTLTVAFEFLAGHYVFGNSWQKLFGDYNVIQGRIWILVLVADFTAPIWAAKLRL